MPPASVAVTVTAHGLEAHVIDSKFCPPEDANLSVPEFTSNNAESVPESVYVGAAEVSASVTERETTFWTFSLSVIESDEVKTGATSSTSVIATVKVVLDVEESALVALTVKSQLSEVS